MNENKAYKEYKNKMNVSPITQKGDSTNAVVYSFDLDTSKFTYELKMNGQPLSLANASEVNIALYFGGDDPENYPKANLIGTIEDRLNSIVSFIMPKQYLGFDGQVLGEIDITFKNGQSLTAGYFSFVMKSSYINGSIEIEQQVYVEQFEDLKNLIGKQSEDINKILVVMQEEIDKSNAKVDEIKDLIVKNDVLKKVEAGPFEEFREWDNTIISKMKNEFAERAVNVLWFKKPEDSSDDICIQRAVDFIKEIDNKNAFKYPDMSLYVGSTHKLVIPSGKYKINKPIINFPQNLIIEGQQAIIETENKNLEACFSLSSSNGWKTEIFGLKFVKINNPIKMNTANLEAGKTEIHHCEFIDCTGFAIDLIKRSQIANIHHNIFHKCDYVMNLSLVDKCFFEKNWVSEKPRWENGQSSFYIDNMTQMFSTNNLFVPYQEIEGVTESAYFDVSGSFISDGDHFGGEKGSKTIVNCKSKYVNNVAKYKSIRIINSADIHASNKPVIRLFEIPNFIEISKCTGFLDNTYFLGYANTKPNNFPDKTNRYIKIIFEGNISTRVFHDGSNFNEIPEELEPFLENPIAYFQNPTIIYPKKIYSKTASTPIKHNIKKIGDMVGMSFSFKVFYAFGSAGYGAVATGIINVVRDYSDNKVSIRSITTLTSNDFKTIGGEKVIPQIKLLFNNGNDVIESSFSAQPALYMSVNAEELKNQFTSMTIQIKEFSESYLN